jgi:hypothetical protein
VAASLELLGLKYKYSAHLIISGSIASFLSYDNEMPGQSWLYDANRRVFLYKLLFFLSVKVATVIVAAKAAAIVMVAA